MNNPRRRRIRRKRYRNEKLSYKLKYALGALLKVFGIIFTGNKGSFKRRTEGLHGRLSFIMKSVLTVFFVLGVWLVGMILMNGGSFSKAAIKNLQINSKDIIAKRGDILDRNGVVLAKSEKAYFIILDSVKLREEEEIEKKNRIRAGEDINLPSVVDNTFEFLANNYKIEKSYIEKIYKEQLAKHDEAIKQKNYSVGLYYRLLSVSGKDYKKLEDEQGLAGTKISKKNVYGEGFFTRVYPYKDVASSVLGFVNKEEIPQTGIELSYQHELSGRNGRILEYYDEVEGKNTKTEAAQDGNNVVLTLDIRVQNLITNKIKEYIKEHKVKDMSILVMDPSNGDVLGMADTPFFDLNDPYSKDGLRIPDKIIEKDGKKTVQKRTFDELSSKEQLDVYLEKWSNYAITANIEPGSTFKPVTLAAGLELKKFELDTKFYCDGGKQFPGAYVYCVNRKGHGNITAAQAIQLSCNDALMSMAEKIGPKDFLYYQTLFNITKKTKIDLPNESNPQTYIGEEKYTPLDLATNSFGQNININMVQLAAANAAIGNNGNYYRPRMAIEVRDSKNYVKEKMDPILERRVISKDVARDTKVAMRMVVEESYINKYGLIEGYSHQLFGKTGTAEKQPRSEGKFISSFIEMAPFDNPKVLVYVVIDEPANNTIGTVDSTKVGSELMRDILPILRIQPTDK